MIITKLILKGYKRLFLNNIEYLEYTPESNIQILLGSNGSGKSSLLNMLNPLPADIKKEFREDGYKLIEIQHAGKEYTISSNFKDKNKHSFIIDNIEYNIGGTKKVQLDLAYEHFKLTPAINNILLGLDNITTMSPSDRKYWFTELSSIDYTFPITVYNKTKQRHRDIVGAIKLLQEEMLAIESDKLTEDKLKSMLTVRETLEDYITYVASQYDHRVSATQQGKTYFEILDITSKNLKMLLEKYRYTELRDSDTIIKTVERLKERENSLMLTIDQLNKDLSILDKLEGANEGSFQIAKDIQTLEEKILDITNNNIYNLPLNNLDNIILSYRSDLPEIVECLNSLKDYVNNDASNENVIMLKSDLDMLTVKIRTVRTTLTQLELEKVQHDLNLSDDNKITCVNCNHTWHNHYEKKQHDKCLSLIKENNIAESELTKQQKCLQDELDKITQKLNIISNLKMILSGHTELKTLWETSFSKANIHKDKYGIIELELEKISYHLDNIASYTVLVNDLAKLKISLKHNEEISVLKTSFVTVKASKLEEQLMESTNLLNKTIVDINELLQELKIVNKMIELKQTIRTHIKLLSKERDNEIKRERNKYLMDLVNDLKQQLVGVDQLIRASQQMHVKLDTNKKLITEYAVKEKVLAIIVKELSPTEGLIAKSINSFLNVFIKEMNYIINSVWSYNIELLPCEISETNDLDYKFRVLVDDNEVIEDVSKLSSSMQEIVNLAFKIIFIKYGGVNETPLILDEFGRTFDPQHRVNAYSIIDSVFSSSFKQIFIVSHYEEQYLRFGNADISILDSSNINIDKSGIINTVLKIVKEDRLP